MIKYGSLNMMLRSLKTRFSHRSDTERWEDEANLDELWEHRSRLIAGLIDTGSKVLEFGAGRGVLRNYLCQSCKYTASDVVYRNEDSLVIDLNSFPLPNIEMYHFDTAVFAGVIEYLVNFPGVISWLGDSTKSCIISHNCISNDYGIIKKRIEIIRRHSYGWNSSFTEIELISLLNKHGFQLKEKIKWETSDGNEDIFLLQKSDL